MSARTSSALAGRVNLPVILNRVLRLHVVWINDLPAEVPMQRVFPEQPVSLHRDVEDWPCTEKDCENVAECYRAVPVQRVPP
jgi:hypothetical protein